MKPYRKLEASEITYRVFWYLRGKPDIHLAKPDAKRISSWKDIPLTSNAADAVQMTAEELRVALNTAHAVGMLPEFGRAKLCIAYDRRGT
jgi:hypothetical protein